MINPFIHPAIFRDRVPPFLYGLVLLLPIGIITAFLAGGVGFNSLSEMWRVSHWSLIPAVVEESHTTPQSSGKYKVSIRFHYDFKGEEFHAKCYEAFNCHELVDAAKADDFVHNYPAGSVITAYVDPENPHRAFVTASMNTWLLACAGTVFFLCGLFFIGYSIHLMWGAVTAFCIVRRWVSRQSSTGTGIGFYFYNSLEAAHKATEWSPLPEGPLKPGRFKERIAPLLIGLLFTCIGIAGVVALITLYNRLPGLVAAVGFILMPGFTIMGIGMMRAAATAKYILHRTGPYGQKEISLLDSQDVPPA